MSARSSRKIIVLFMALAIGVGCSSTSSSSSSGVRWPWTKSKTAAQIDEEKRKNSDVLGTPPAPKHAKAGVNKPSGDLPSNVTLRTPRIIDDREIERANR